MKYSLVHKSPNLQSIYIKSIVEELRYANNSDLDSFFFGPLSMGYENSGKNLLSLESRKMVVDYLKEVHHKYTEKGIKDNLDDPYRGNTSMYYFELIHNMGGLD